MMNKKEEEITKAVLEWLDSKGYSSAADSLSKDSGISLESKSIGGVLEKKWTTILIMQKKILDLESQLKESKEQSEVGGFASFSSGKLNETSVFL